MHKYKSNIQSYKNLHYGLCLLFIFLLLFCIIILNMSIWFYFFFFGKSHIYSTLYLIMKFLGYIIYFIANLNDFMIKFCLNNLKNYVIYLWGFFFFFLNGSLLTYVVRIFFWQFTKWSLTHYYYKIFTFKQLNLTTKWSLIILLCIAWVCN